MLLRTLMLCVIVVHFSKSIAADGDFVDLAIDALEKAREPKGFYYDNPNEITSLAISLFDKMDPLANITSGGREIKPDQPEYDQLMRFENLTNEFGKGWMSLEASIDGSNRRLGPMRYADYDMEVSEPLKKMKLAMDNVRNPSIPKTREQIKKYKEECDNGVTNPYNILQAMEDHLMNYCKTPITPTEAQKIADVRLHCLQVMRRLALNGEQFPRSCEEYILEFLAINNHLELEKIQEMDETLNVFGQSFSSDDEAMRSYLKELRVKGNVDKDVEKEKEKCLLRNLITQSGSDYNIVMNWMTRFKKEVIQLSYVLLFCNNVGGRKSPDIPRNALEERVGMITRHIALYLNESMAAAWPAEHQVILKSIVQYFAGAPGVFDDRKMESVQNSACRQLENTGDINYVYQIAVVKTPKDNYQILLNGSEHYCSMSNSFYGFDLILGRIPFNRDTFELIEHRRLNVEMYDNGLLAADFKEIIPVEMEVDGLYRAPTLNDIVPVLLNKFEKPLIGDKQFRCMAVARHWKYTCPALESWTGPHNYLKLESMDTEGYENDDISYDCQKFRFIFLR